MARARAGNPWEPWATAVLQSRPFAAVPRKGTCLGRIAFIRGKW